MEKQRKRILAVDDDVVNVQVYKELLEEDYELRVAMSGQEALEVAATFHPDLVLLDIMMPGMSGYEACRRLKEDLNLRFVKIILVSAKSMTSERIKGYEMGADDYVTKPFDHEELLAKVHVFVKLKCVEEVDQLKAEILSLLSHETFTPLNAIVAPAEMLMMDESMEYSERLEWARMISSGAKELFRFIEMVILTSQFKASVLDLDRESIDILPLVQETLDALEGKVDEKKIDVRVSSSGSGQVIGNPRCLNMILITILSEALAKSPREGALRLDLKTLEDDLSLSVTHDYSCLDAEGADEGQVAETTPTKLSSLSFSLVGEIVEKLEGSLSVQSCGGERTVTLTLPVKLTTPAE